MTEREEIVERLKAASLGGGGSEGLSNIAMAIYEPSDWWSIGACGVLRQRLINLLAFAPSGVSITDELRKWFDRYTIRKDVYDELTAIADRIDAAHQKAEDEWKAKDGQTWLRGYGECHAELMEGNEVIAADLERAGWVKLPKDADEYIHEHDKVDWRDHAGTWHENATVVAVCNDGCYVMDGTVFHVHKSDIRHHHEPTVEDVLREFAQEMNENMGMYTGEAIDADEWRDADNKTIAEYAARLRLADDGKEQ